MNETNFLDRVIEAQGGPLRASGLRILQVNLGYRCNMACKHCHVRGGPERTETMEAETAEAVIRALSSEGLETLDLTGGAPELNPGFRRLVTEGRALGKSVIVRTNLTVFFEPGMQWLPGFLAESNVDVIASLPYYIEDTVDRVRGGGAFGKCKEALRTLNSLGFGQGDGGGMRGGGGKTLSLVYNPQGAFLPPEQAMLEEEYKRELLKRFGIKFDNLYTFSNMPIGRFRDFLLRTNGLQKYLDRLSGSFNPSALERVMCRQLISVGWDGALYDCDFNQIIGLETSEGTPGHIGEFDYGKLTNRAVSVDEHCYACTAGQGST